MSASKWIEAIDKAQKGKRKRWIDRGRKIVERYRDERSETEGVSRFNILWSNIQTLKPALFSRAPNPNVARRFKDQDELGREAATILERALSYSIDEYDFEEEIASAVEDRLLPGKGQVRIRYKPHYAPMEDGDQFQEVIYEEVYCEYVFWEDYIEIGNPRRWSELDAIAYRAYLTRDELIEQFGEKGKKVKLDHKPSGEEAEESTKKATVYEIWDKQKRKVYFVAKSYKDEYLDETDPPLSFSGFYPSPRPLTSTTTNDTIIPIPDFSEYQDQAEEIDELTARIGLLVEALKVVGVYDASAQGLERMLEAGCENKLIPIESWAAFAEKGGIKGAIDWLPIEQVAAVLVRLYEAREQAKQDLYEITGLSDIVRGVTNPNETLGAQRLKGQFATSRLNDAQKETARFVRDVLRLKAEVIAEEFSPQTISLMTGKQVSRETMSLLQNDLLRGFRIDIETDSTVESDEQAEKESRVEFLRAASEFMATMQPIVQAVPEMSKLAGKMLLFGVRGFKAGRDLESEIEDALDKIEQSGQQPQQPSQEEIKGQKELELKEREQNRKEAETAHSIQSDNLEPM